MHGGGGEKEKANSEFSNQNPQQGGINFFSDKCLHLDGKL